MSDSPISEQIVLTIFGQCLTNGDDNRERTFFWTDLDKKSSLVENNSECTTKKMEEHYELKLRQNCKWKTKKTFGICATQFGLYDYLWLITSKTKIDFRF